MQGQVDAIYQALFDLVTEYGLLSVPLLDVPHDLHVLHSPVMSLSTHHALPYSPGTRLSQLLG